MRFYMAFLFSKEGIGRGKRKMKRERIQGFAVMRNECVLYCAVPRHAVCYGYDQRDELYD